MICPRKLFNGAKINLSQAESNNLELFENGFPAPATIINFVLLFHSLLLAVFVAILSSIGNKYSGFPFKTILLNNDDNSENVLEKAELGWIENGLEVREWKCLQISRVVNQTSQAESTRTTEYNDFEPTTTAAAKNGKVHCHSRVEQKEKRSIITKIYAFLLLFLLKLNTRMKFWEKLSTFLLVLFSLV